MGVEEELGEVLEEVTLFLSIFLFAFPASVIVNFFLGILERTG